MRLPIRQKRKEAFLQALSEMPIVARAAKEAGVNRSTVYQWKLNKRFAAAYEIAFERGLDRLEEILMDIALHGWKREVYQGGRLVGFETVRDVRIMELVLKANRPEKYGDRSAIDVNLHVELPQRLAAGEARLKLLTEKKDGQ
jgi:hypothetical protein